MRKKSSRYVRILLAAVMTVAAAGTSVPYTAVEAKAEDSPAGQSSAESRQAAEKVFTAEWDMDEGEGTVINDRNSAYPGTLSGGVAWTEGKNGSGLAFDGES